MIEQIQKLLTENRITVTQADRLSWYIAQEDKHFKLQPTDLDNITQPALKTLVQDETFSIVLHPDFNFSIQNLLHIQESGYNALLDTQIVEYIYKGKINTIPVLNKILELTQKARAKNATIHTTSVNPALQEIALPITQDDLIATTEQEQDKENVHNTGLNNSVSNTLLKLYSHYGSILKGKQLFNTLLELYDWIDSLPSDKGGMNDIAKRAIKRLATSNYKSYKEPTSNLSILQVLLLVWIAMHDTNKRFNATAEGLSTAYDRFIKTLVSIEYRDIKNPKDAHLEIPADPTCVMGTPNKLVYAIYTIHQDVELSYQTFSQATKQLQHLVKLEVKKYLYKIFNELNLIDNLTDKTQALIEIKELFQEIKQKNSEILFSKIRHEITERIYQEFPNLFQSNTDPELIAFIDNGNDVDLQKIIDEFAAKLELEQETTKPRFRMA